MTELTDLKHFFNGKVFGQKTSRQVDFTRVRIRLYQIVNVLPLLSPHVSFSGSDSFKH